MSRLALLLVVLRCNLYSVVAKFQKKVDVETPQSKYAYATIFYDSHASSDRQYFVGARTALKSVQQTNTNYDRIALVAPDTSSSYIKDFESDGIKVKTVGDDVPAGHHSKDFWLSYLRVALWSLQEYDKVIFVDSSTLVYRSIDDLFGCGLDLCAIFYKMEEFHTGFFVVKPSSGMYESHSRALTRAERKNELTSAYQFMNDLYPTACDSLFYRGTPESVRNFNRIDLKYMLNHFYFWETLSFTPLYAKSVEEVRGISFVSGTSLIRPWNWWCYPYMDKVGDWISVRNHVESIWTYWGCLLALAVCPMLHLALSYLSAREGCQRHPSLIYRGGKAFIEGMPSLLRDFFVGLVPLVVGWSVILFVMLSVVLLIPVHVPSILGWPLFLSYFVMLTLHFGRFSMMIFGNVSMPQFHFSYVHF